MSFYTDEQLSMILSANVLVRDYWYGRGIFADNMDIKELKMWFRTIDDTEKWLHNISYGCSYWSNIPKIIERLHNSGIA